MTVSVDKPERRAKMNWRIILIIIGFVITAIILFGFTDKTFARNGKSSGGSHTKRLQPIVLPPPRPPGFPYKWVGKDLIKRFTEDGLEIEKTKPVAKGDYINLPAKAKEIVSFSIPSLGEDMGGYILCFEKKNNLEKVKKHYFKLNGKGELYMWSFVKDNIILILSGAIAEEKARQYESALNDLKQ